MKEKSKIISMFECKFRINFEIKDDEANRICTEESLKENVIAKAYQYFCDKKDMKKSFELFKESLEGNVFSELEKSYSLV